MNFLLDTNVVSEWVKPAPAASVVEWLDNVDEDRVFLSVVTIAELRHGIERMSPGRRRDRLSAWLEQELPERFGERILVIDRGVAEAWGRVMAAARAERRPMPAMAAFLAATAEHHELTLVTRDTDPFRGLRRTPFNPWLQP